VTPAALLSGTTIAAQIALPLVPDYWVDGWIAAVVLLFAAASAAHAWRSRGPLVAVLFVVATAALGYGAEVLGVHTGFPFGTYVYAPDGDSAYGNGLGPMPADVPLVIGLAWVMFTWPAALVARRVVRGFWARVAMTAWALAAWDLFLDPQMVHFGQWRWADPSPHLPGVPTVPLTNLLGWLLVGTVIALVAQGILAAAGDGDGDDRWPHVLFVWTWLSSTLALAVFWDLTAAAAWGYCALAVVAVPFLRCRVAL